MRIRLSLTTWQALALVTALWAPPIAYLTTWPAAVAGAVVLGTARATSAARLAGWIGVALATSIVLVPAVDVLFHLVSPRPGNPDSELTPAFVVTAMLIVLSIFLLGAVATADRSRRGDRRAP